MQKLLPFLINSEGTYFESPADYAIGFKYCIDNKKEGEKLVNFSRLAWPFILIHASPSAHLIIDDVGICDLDLKITNPPRQATIGHVLRNINSNTYTEMLDKINAVISYTEEGQDIKTLESSDEFADEYRNIHLNGLVNPDIIKGIIKLIKNLDNQQISDYALLESQYSVDIGLELAEKYKNLIINVKGNKVRWNGIKELVQKPFSEWIAELNVQIKDAQLRYKSSVTKEEKNISAQEVTGAINSEKDQVEQWKLLEKKAILEKIGGLFLPIDNFLEELRNSNKIFLNTNSFKQLQVEEAISKVNTQIERLTSIDDTIQEKINNIKKSFTFYIKEMRDLDEQAEQRVKNIEVDLKTKLIQRNSRIKSISEASEKYIKDLKLVEESLHKSLAEIEHLIEKKKEDCDKEVVNISKWGLQDEHTGISQSVLRIFMPIYIALYEDEDEDERLEFILPGQLNQNLALVPLSKGFSKLKEKIDEVVEDDMKIRSNFEFTMEKLNLIHHPKTLKWLQKGFKLLRMKGLTDISTENKYVEEFKSLTQEE